MLIRPKTPNSIEVQLVNWIAGLVQSNIDLANVLVRLRDSYRIASQGGSPRTPMTLWQWLN